MPDYGSSFRLSRLLWAQRGEVRVDCLFLAPGDHVGLHPAGLLQLFCVLQGEGWVRADDGERRELGAGDAASWSPGEPHQAGSEGGMTALVIQAEDLDPATLLPPL